MTWSPHADAVLGGDEHELGGFERLGDRQRDAVGVDAVGFAVAVKAQRAAGPG